MQNIRWSKKQGAANPSVVVALRQAMVALEAGRPRVALRQCEDALAVQPGHPDALYLSGTIACELGEFEQGAERLRLAITAKPGFAEAYANLGNACCELDQAEEAEAAFREALALQPDWAPVYNNLGGLLKETGREAEAEAAHRRAVELAPGEPTFLFNLGNVLMHQGQTDEAFEMFERGTAILRRPGDLPALDETDFRRTCATKLRHDAEQFRHLVEHGKLPEKFRQIAADYDAARAALPDPAPDMLTVDLPPPWRVRLAPVYNRLVYRAEAPALAGGALNPDLDTAAIEAAYQRNAPGWVYFDELLRPQALESLRRFCLDSTFWFAHGFANGYLGAVGEDGFTCPLLSQVIEELRLALPGIMGENRLCKAWAFKYDNDLQGIKIHADAAAVNVNFWVTPDDANLDLDGGGLVVWDTEAPKDWDFSTYNTNEAEIRRFLAESNAKAIAVPHRQNRAVVFNSDLFHETAPLNFRDGFENRRVNITLLYGERGGRE